ncbi:carboxymuconolactone decarboxylase family protein [Marinobacter sp. R17]|uniref:carboxymuconolactone decarboxylase family protein n=1 Tax=Marinobacter sp. R17 TaxID=2484250 RepID=UPI000F4CEF9C|nr:carboxymuconolactone decarboxylase family protein [Marinobacter sp. R17]ROT95804.1 carboxymuconolactone decarboxylase family protein [Marinobacter sp. R17]
MSLSPGIARQAFGDVAPKLAEITDDLLFADVWCRDALGKRERSIATVSALIVLDRSEQLPFHLERALENGVSHSELAELVTQLAFYGGWPVAASAVGALRKLSSRSEE